MDSVEKYDNQPKFSLTLRCHGMPRWAASRITYLENENADLRERLRQYENKEAV